MSIEAVAKRIVTYARAQADQLDWTDRYACFNQVIRALAGVRDDRAKSPSGFMRCVAVLEEVRRDESDRR